MDELKPCAVFAETVGAGSMTACAVLPGVVPV